MLSVVSRNDDITFHGAFPANLLSSYNKGRETVLISIAINETNSLLTVAAPGEFGWN